MFSGTIAVPAESPCMHETAAELSEEILGQEGVEERAVREEKRDVWEELEGEEEREYDRTKGRRLLSAHACRRNNMVNSAKRPSIRPTVS